MKLTLESIRERFPNPVRESESNKRGAYCVGGAFCNFTGPTNSFPSAFGLGKRLQAANPLLGIDRAENIAEQITQANDSGDFETAWAKLGEALSWGETK